MTATAQARRGPFTPDLAVGTLLGGWGLFYPHPLGLCVTVLALAPAACIGIALISRGEVSLNAHRWPQPRPSIGVTFILGALALAARGANDVHLIDWQASLVAAVGLGTIFAAAAIAAEREFRTALMGVLIALVGSGWGWGLAVEANAFLDRGAWTDYPAKVQAKSFTRGRSSSTYYLHLLPGSVPGVQDKVTVYRGLCHRIEVGGTVCVDVAPGWLGWRWYSVRACS
jgi:hypothetical protein